MVLRLAGSGSMAGQGVTSHTFLHGWLLPRLQASLATLRGTRSRPCCSSPARRWASHRTHSEEQGRCACNCTHQGSVQPLPALTTSRVSTLPRPLPCQVVISNQAKAAYLVSGTTWISFDLPQTIYMKILAARERGLGGLMVRRGTAGCRLSPRRLDPLRPACDC